MNTNLKTILLAGTMLGAFILAPAASFARDNDHSEVLEEYEDQMDELRDEIEELRDELREAREEAREELREARDEAREERHERSTRGERGHSRITINGEEREMTPSERAEFERDMAEFEREMEEFGREMATMDLEFDHHFDFSEFEDGMAEFAEEMAEFAVEMAGLEGEIMAELEASGLRIESDDNGNETVWLSGDHRGNGDADMRVVSTRGGDDLVYFYFNGFEEDYDFVLEDGPGDSTIIHAYDTSAVIIEATNRRNHNNVETDLDSRGRPQLTIITRDEDDYEVVRLERRRFN